jgi:glycosyltransferase involved in cell wall biosynthesis
MGSVVDVVVPCYNYGRYLRECVKSVLDQEDVKVRVLVIDDASPDNTPEVAAQLVAEDPRVQYRRHAVNRGHIGTYNEGLLEWARSEYSLLLSADDALAPGALRRAVALLDSHPEVGMAYGRVVRTTDPGAEPPAPEGAGVAVLSGIQFIRLCCEEAGNPVPTPTAVVRTRTQQEVGGYRPELPHTGDMEMWLRFATRAAVGVIGSIQAYQRFHPTNMSVDYRGLRDVRARRAAFDAVFDRPAGALVDGPELRSVAYRKLAGESCRIASVAFKAGATAAEVCEYLKVATELWSAVRRHPRFMKVRAELMLGVTVSRALTAALNRLRTVRRRDAGGEADLLRRPYSIGSCSPASVMSVRRRPATSS